MLKTGETLSDIRDRIHSKSHEYFTMGYGRVKKSDWKMFYGATDALQDASMAARAFGQAVKSDPANNLLVCYGFLQAIYIQQDAVLTLSRAVGLKWHPKNDARLKEIRDVRNRLTGHPAIAGENEKPKRLSSAVISYSQISSDAFHGTIYYEDRFEPIVVNVMSILKDNETRLGVQMLEIENKMDALELKFRTDQSTRPLSCNFGKGFDYLVQRLHCDLFDEDRLVQAQTHCGMIREILDRLKKDLDNRGFASIAPTYNFGRIFTGLGILSTIMRQDTHSETDQHKFDLVFDGVTKNVEDVLRFIDELDARLRTPIGAQQA